MLVIEADAFIAAKALEGKEFYTAPTKSAKRARNKRALRERRDRLERYTSLSFEDVEEQCFCYLKF
jgi:hypothetical protein